VYALPFFNEFERMYEDAENGIFKEKEWHDSYIFDVVRKWHESKFGVKNNDYAKGLIKGEGHPIINTELGAYIDHMKGTRKDAGRSKASDLKIKRTEEHWK